MRGFSPFTKTRKEIAAQITKKWRQRKAARIQKRIDAREARVKNTDRNKKTIKRLEDKKFNVENPWWKSKEKELDALGSRPENKPYWQSDYQKKMAKQGIKTSGYLDAKYRRSGKKSYAPGLGNITQESVAKHIASSSGGKSPSMTRSFSQPQNMQYRVSKAYQREAHYQKNNEATRNNKKAY
tara:strand:+ start:237 stop:785 length:549 start_codon:yes stop_codon:yes gene_type:complete